MRKLIITAVACATVSLLAACGNSDPSEPTSFNPVQFAKVKSVTIEARQCVVRITMPEYPNQVFVDTFAITNAEYSEIDSERDKRWCGTLKNGDTVPIYAFYGDDGYPDIEWRKLGFYDVY